VIHQSNIALELGWLLISVVYGQFWLTYQLFNASFLQIVRLKIALMTDCVLKLCSC